MNKYFYIYAPAVCVYAAWSAVPASAQTAAPALPAGQTGPAAEDAAADPGSESAMGVGDIVVTARRRAETFRPFLWP